MSCFVRRRCYMKPNLDQSVITDDSCWYDLNWVSARQVLTLERVDYMMAFLQKWWLWPRTSDFWSSPSPQDPVHWGNVHTGYKRSWWPQLANDHHHEHHATFFLALPIHWFSQQLLFLHLLDGVTSFGCALHACDGGESDWAPPSTLTTGKRDWERKRFLFEFDKDERFCNLTIFVVLYKHHTYAIIIIT